MGVATSAMATSAAVWWSLGKNNDPTKIGHFFVLLLPPSSFSATSISILCCCKYFAPAQRLKTYLTRQGRGGGGGIEVRWSPRRTQLQRFSICCRSTCAVCATKLWYSFSFSFSFSANMYAERYSECKSMCICTRVKCNKRWAGYIW